MNRQQRRRAEREGKKGSSRDIIIASVVGVVVLLLFATAHLFPNLNLSNYEGASPRVLHKIVQRGVNWLEKDWPQMQEFTYGHYDGKDEWPSYAVQKSDEVWQFTDLTTKETVKYEAEPPAFYHDLGDLIADLQEALRSSAYELKFQQSSGGYNIVSVIKQGEDESQQVKFF